MTDCQMNDTNKHCARFQERKRALWRGSRRSASQRADGNWGDREMWETKLCVLGGGCIKGRDE